MNDAQFGIIPLNLVIPSKTNPRKNFDQVALQELADSIKLHGVAQPILCRPHPNKEEHPDCVEIVAGERRFRASKLADMESIPAIVRNMTDLEVLELQIIENLQRADVNEIEEADGYERLMKEYKFTAEMLAEKVGKSRRYIFSRLKLRSLVPAAREAFYAGKLNASTALLVARIPLPALQERATLEITDQAGEPMSYRRAVQHIQDRYMLKLTTAPFPIKDAKLYPLGGSCETCEKRTGNQPEVFADVSADVCTDPDCYSMKRKAYDQKTIDKAQKKGVPVYECDEDVPEEVDENLMPLTVMIHNFDRVNESKVARYEPISKLLPVELRPEPAALVKDKDGNPVPMYEKTALQLALEKAGICESQAGHEERMNETESTEKAQAKKEEEKKRVEQANMKAQRAKEETEFRVELYKKVREQLQQDGDLTLEALRTSVKMIVADMYAEGFVEELYDFDINDEEAFAKFADAATPNQISLFLMDFMISTSLEVNTWHLDDKGEVEEENKNTTLMHMAKHCRIDADALRNEMLPPKVVAKVAPGKKAKAKTKAAETTEAPQAATEEKVEAAVAEPAPVAEATTGKGKKKTLPASAAWPFPIGARK